MQYFDYMCIFYKCVIVTYQLIYIDIYSSGCGNVIPLWYNKTLENSTHVCFMSKVHTTTHACRFVCLMFSLFEALLEDCLVKWVAASWNKVFLLHVLLLLLLLLLLQWYVFNNFRICSLDRRCGGGR